MIDPAPDARVEPTMRRLSWDDVASLADLFVANDLPEVRRFFLPFPLTAATARELLAKERKDRFYGALAGSQLVGFAMLRGWDEGYEVPSFGLLVDREWQARGVGARLTRFVLADADGMGCARVRLTVKEANSAALRIYLSCGFEEVERKTVMLDGRAYEKLVMLRVAQRPDPKAGKTACL